MSSGSGGSFAQIGCGWSIRNGENAPSVARIYGGLHRSPVCKMMDGLPVAASRIRAVWSSEVVSTYFPFCQSFGRRGYFRRPRQERQARSGEHSKMNDTAPAALIEIKP
jgi:hypothetical protein